MKTNWRVLRFGGLILTGAILGGTATLIRGQESASPNTTAAVISSVVITQDGQRVAIRVEGSGHLDLHPARLQNPERLVLDFPGAWLNVRKTSIPGVSAPVRGVRAGQFRPDVARVVIDLTVAAPYQIAYEGGAVVVYLQTQPESTNEAAVATSATSKETQKQIAAPATSSQISGPNDKTNAATAHLPSPKELTEPPASPATTNEPVLPGRTEHDAQQAAQQATTSLAGSAKLSQARGTSKNGGDFSRDLEAKKLPTGVILVKGAWSGTSDPVTPVPEGGSVNDNVYNNPYFGLRYTLSRDWTQKYSAPPPSDSGYYVLAQIRPTETSEQAARGSILITAQDLFFTLTPSTSANELIQYTSDTLGPDYKVELPPTGVQLANHSFVRFEYGSPVADLHWNILATQIRCHALQFIFTSHDAKLAESLIQGMNAIQLTGAASAIGVTDEGGAPVCIKDYASGETVLARVDPIFTERRFNSVPVRIIIDKEGKVKHIHFLSAFPDQEKAVTEALRQWRFKPYLRDGQPVEVETGIMFGHPPRPVTRAENNAVIE